MLYVIIGFNMLFIFTPPFNVLLPIGITALVLLLIAYYFDEIKGKKSIKKDERINGKGSG